MKKSLKANAELVKRVSELALNENGRAVLRELLEKVAGDEEVVLESDAQNSNSTNNGINPETLREKEKKVVRRATIPAEREQWINMFSRLSDFLTELNLEINSNQKERESLSANSAQNKQKGRKAAKKTVDAQQSSIREDLIFLIEETASVVISLIELTKEETNLTTESPVVVRLGGLLIHHCEVLTQATAAPGGTKTKVNLPKLAPLAGDGLLRTPANRLTQAAIEAFMPGALKRGSEATEILEKIEAHGLLEKFWAVYPVETKRKDLFGIGGFRQDPGEALFETLQTKGDIAVRAQFALWSRAYQETNAEPGKLIKITINQFCDDIGFARHKGAHKRENKRSAVKILELLTSFEVSILWKTPKGKWARVRGPIWQKGALGEEFEYGDLFGNNRAGDPDSWDPVAFAYAPGYLFDNEDWRHYNRAVALIGQGLLTLSAQDRDKWAVLIGGYIALQARFGDYRPKRFKVKTLLEKTGLDIRAENRHAARTIDRLEAALDRLREVNVIADWSYTDKEADEDIDFNNLDAAETRQAMAQRAGTRRRVRDELERVIEIEWTDILTSRSLSSEKEKLLETPQNKARRSNKNKK